MSGKSTKKLVISGLVWKFGERISAQLVTFVISIILARILEPEHYGAIAIVNIFIAIANVFVDSGFGSSLIQKKEVKNIDFSSVFYFSIISSLLLYFLIFIIAPHVAKFYSMEVLSPVLRILGIRLIVAGVNTVQHAYVSKHMLFKKFFCSTLVGTVISGIVGIVLAYMGYGIWALVAQYMTNTTVDTIVLWFTVKWRPGLEFSFNRLKSMFSYGWKLLVSGILETGYNELRSLIIGKKYASQDLAYYNRGMSFPSLIVKNVNSSIQSVIFPALSNEQEKCERVKTLVRHSIRISSYIMMPLMIGLALTSNSVIKLLLTDKWIACVPYMQIVCIDYMFMPIHTANLQAIKAMGRSDIFLKLEIIKKLVGVLIIIFVMDYGVMAIALSGLLMTILSAIINSWPNKKLISYSCFQQIKDLFNGIIPLVAMVICVLLVGMIPLSPLMLLLAQSIIGVFVYLFISYITKNQSFNYILSTIKDFLNKK